MGKSKLRGPSIVDIDGGMESWGGATPKRLQC